VTEYHEPLVDKVMGWSLAAMMVGLVVAMAVGCMGATLGEPPCRESLLSAQGVCEQPARLVREEGAWLCRCPTPELVISGGAR
jgi:hypothetical protein